MNDGDVLAEIRSWRDEFARSHGFDVHAIAAVLRALDTSGERKVIHGEPRRPVTVIAPQQTTQPPGIAISVPLDLKSVEAAPAAEL